MPVDLKHPALDLHDTERRSVAQAGRHRPSSFPGNSRKQDGSLDTSVGLVYCLK